jgi:pimeloyl-ACP methyl ester carboxylesterase
VRGLILAGTNCGPVVDTLRIWGDKKADRLRDETTASARRFMKAHEANAARPDLTKRLSEIRKPVLIVVGERDAITPRHISELMLRGIPDAQMKVIPECGHRCHEDQPDSFNSIVSDFLCRVEAGQLP